MRHVLLILVMVLSGCPTGGPCVNDEDCEAGSRCNTGFTTPTCQRLYSAGTGAPCSGDFFCQSKLCTTKTCAAEGSAAALGSVVPVTSTYPHTVDGGFVPSIFFSDDARNDCASLDTRMEYGKLAALTFSVSSPLTEGQVVPWVLDSDVRTGVAHRPFAVFTHDTLSGLELHKHGGTATVVHLPSTTDQTFVVRLESNDAVLSGRFVATDICP